MSGQAANISLEKAKAAAKGAGHEMGCSSGGSKTHMPTKGKELGHGSSPSAPSMPTGKRMNKVTHG
jgi:hypothetical protein